MQQDSAYVYVPVPSHLVDQVQAYVVQLSGAVSPEAPPGQGAGTPAGRWTVALLRKFAQTQLSSTQNVSRLLDVLADQPGEYVSTTQLVGDLSIDRTQLRGALSALTRHLNKHFDGRGWPMRWIEQLSPSPQFKTEFFYTMDDDTAQKWKDARSQE